METPSTSRRRRSEMIGRLAEEFVAAGWVSRGYEVLAQRIRTSAGEIDLVVADSQMLVFVEVKARRSFADAVYAVQPRQQRRLLSAAESILAAHPEWSRPATRFDVAVVCGGTVELIEDAIRH